MGAAWADPVPDADSLPRWVLRAQERLSLKPAQRRELCLLVDENSERLRTLQNRCAVTGPDDSGRAQCEEMAGLQQKFRIDLALILSGEQLAAWDALLGELLGDETGPGLSPMPEVH
jgi:hypothetical protein